MCGTIFSIHGVHIPSKCIESIYFYSCPSSPLKTPGRIFWKSVSPKTKWVEKTMICFIKIQPENIKMTWNIGLFIFCMIYNFSKCDSFTILWILLSKLAESIEGKVMNKDTFFIMNKIWRLLLQENTPIYTKYFYCLLDQWAFHN